MWSHTYSYVYTHSHVHSHVHTQLRLKCHWVLLHVIIHAYMHVYTHSLSLTHTHTLTRPTAQFSVNGKCGYVLKPAWMLQPDSMVKNPLPKRTPRQLCVSIYSAYARQAGILCFKDDMYVAVSRCAHVLAVHVCACVYVFCASYMYVKCACMLRAYLCCVRMCAECAK